MISAGDPDAMLRHTEECRDRGYPFAADPSQQLARMDGEEAGGLITGARPAVHQRLRDGLLKSKTGWSDAEVLSRVGYRVTTHGPRGVEVVAADGSSLTVPALPETAKVDPTGVGDGFRAGFLAGRAGGLGFERAAQLGSLMATLVLETTGAQEYALDAGIGPQPAGRRLRRRGGRRDRRRRQLVRRRSRTAVTPARREPAPRRHEPRPGRPAPGSPG